MTDSGQSHPNTELYDMQSHRHSCMPYSNAFMQREAMLLRDWGLSGIEIVRDLRLARSEGYQGVEVIGEFEVVRELSVSWSGGYQVALPP